ncbi:MAG: hypothetical protein OEL56_01995 [Nitrosopumilus sp.]|nr:hypothetical protein [Nitrosopumilus sp.]MDH3489198.1 hypothetical protein [Nitrosopumilus sp.]MDH3516197.1 hypothetical protein [Nitrosopumilus sp.]MDH3565472.1 hypothetical protein [Nitrosopumilus sp.]MDH5416961.1 hypothetical protein [Nitrosopumilus sp.]
MNIDSHIENAARAIHNAKMVRDASKKILAKKSNIHPEHIQELSKIMQGVISSTDKAMKGAQLAESRAKSRLAAVKKETSKIITHTRNAKYAAIAARKSANAALTTSKKMTNPQLGKKYQRTYDIQITAAIRAAKVAEKETQKATLASKTARIAARMALKKLQI